MSQRLYYHPEYKARVGRWRDYLDATSPETYIVPRYGSGVPSYYDGATVTTEDDVRAMIDRVITAESSFAVLAGGGSASRIQRHQRESDARYRARCALAVHYGIGDGICDVIARHAAVPGEKTQPRQEDPRWMAHDRDVTGDGMTRAAFERELVYWAAIFGACHAIAWRATPKADLPGGAVSLAAMQRAGTYLSLVTPIDLVAWGDGFVVVRSWWEDAWSFGQEPKPAAPVFTEYRSDVIRRFKLRDGREAEGAELELVEEVPGVGIVPMVTMYFRDKSTCPHPIGDGAMRILEPIDRSILNLDSLRQDYIINGCFQQRFVPSGMLDGMAKVGNGIYLGMEPGDAAPTVIDADPTPFDKITALIAERATMARNAIGIGRGQAEESIATRSGDAAKVEREDKYGLLRCVVGQLERASNAIDRMWWRVATGSDLPESMGGTVYSRAFNGVEFEDDVAGVLDKALTLGLPPTAEREARKFAGRSVIQRYAARADVAAALDGVEQWARDQEAATSAPVEREPQPLNLGVEQVGAIVLADEARARMGLPPRGDSRTVAETMAESATTVAAASAAASGSEMP